MASSTDMLTFLNFQSCEVNFVISVSKKVDDGGDACMLFLFSVLGRQELNVSGREHLCSILIVKEGELFNKKLKTWWEILDIWFTYHKILWVFKLELNLDKGKSWLGRINWEVSKLGRVRPRSRRGYIL